MAATHKVLKISRPVADTYDANGDWSGLVVADHLLVKVDVFSNGLQLELVRLDFATYAGLETEYLAGVATTVLAAAITTEIAATTFPDTILTTAQRALIGTEYPSQA